jgi:hypothetical protein
MSYVVADGKSNWLEGTILVCKPFSIPVSDSSAYTQVYQASTLSLQSRSGSIQASSRISFNNEISSRAKFFSYKQARICRPPSALPK